LELELLVDDGPGGPPHGVLVEFRDGATVRDLRLALTGELAAQRYPGDTTQLYTGDQAIPDAALLSDAGLVDGQLVALSPGASSPVFGPDGDLHVAVAGGVHAGAGMRVWPGLLLTVGRAAGCDLRVADEEVSRQHAAFWQEPADGVLSVRDAGSRNGVRRGGQLLAGDTPVGVGDVLGIGESVLEVTAPDPIRADITAGIVPGTRAFNRPPRIAEPWQRPELTVPAEPAKPRGFRFPWVALVLPLVLVGGLALVLHPFPKYLLIMVLISPLMMVSNLIGDRRSGRKEYSAKLADFRAAYGAFEAYLAVAADADQRRSRAQAPDPAEIVRRAMLPAATLWQRRSRDEEFLRLRLGLVDRSADIGLHRGGPDQPLPERPTVYDVPVTVDLRTAGVLGVSGSRPVVLAAARSLLTQAAVLHAPGELAIAVITGMDTAADWEWASWLPHVRPWSSALACRRLFATDAAQAAARVSELLDIVAERATERRALLGDGPPPGRAVLVVLDGARRLRGVPGLAQLLADGPAVGIYTVCFDGEETALPDECRATLVASADAATRATVRRPGLAPVEDVLIDGLTLARAGVAARALTPIRALGGSDGDTELPERVRFTELIGLSADPDAVRRAWNESPTGRSSRAVIGVSGDGPLIVDLVKDGPHGLVTGTSGAGKSELLQTLVASLALANTPDALTFVLVDYKGGSAFGPCADLPHCVGMVTDLDGHLVSRALDSLSAELRRREGLFAEAGAKDIDDYWARTGARLPRLVIVVDEFASLVEEIPDFVPGVVGIGMRGRSLGVHVVLATQRPGGVVTADMRANVNLRISLRVTSEAESNDVIDSPAAARIPPRQPGRAYLRTGHRELTAFQAARVGWPLEEQVSTGAPPVLVVPRRVDALGVAVDRGTSSDVDEHGHTDLSDLVEAIQRAAVEAGIAAPSRPWLPPLPEQISLATLDPPGAGPAVAVIGMVDRPSAQAQDPFVLDLAATGPVVVAGTARTGRSTALRTIAASLAQSASPADLHLYALDCGNHALAALGELPHCGAVVDGADEARTERLLSMLAAEVNRRQVLLGAGGHGSIAEQRAAVAAADRLPQVVVLLDRLEAFVSRYGDVNGGALLDRVETLLRTGPSAGIVCVLASDRTGFTHRIGTAVASRLVMRQATPDDMVYFGVDHRAVPARMPDGRAIWTSTGQEVQFALLDAAASGAGQVQAVKRLAEELARRWDGVPPQLLPRRVDQLPDTIDLATMNGLRTAPRRAGDAVVTVGVGGDHLGPIDLDLAEHGGCFVVAGPARSGRSSALCALVDSLEGTLPVVCIAPRPSPLRSVEGALTDKLALADILLQRPEPIALVIDDAELLDDRAVIDLLERFVRDVRDTGSVLIAAATTEDLLLNRYRGWLSSARRDRTGLLLNPATHLDGDVFDLRLPRSTSGGWPPGRGLLSVRGEALTVQVPLPAEHPTRR